MLAVAGSPSDELGHPLASCPAGEGEGVAAPERRRWLAAVIITLVGSNQGIVWMTFSASSAELQALLPEAGISDGEVDLLLNWGPIGCLLTVWYFMLQAARRGPKAVHECVQLGAFLIFVGAALRGIPFCWPSCPWPRVWLHAGQILNGLASPVGSAVAPSFAANWFPAQERTLATSLVWTCQSAAPALGFAVALAADSTTGLRGILAAEAASALGAMVLWSCAVPPVPRSAPSRSAGAQRRGACGAASDSAGEAPGTFEALAALRSILSRRRFGLLALGGGLSIGAFQCWTSCLAVLFPATVFPSIGGLRTGLLLSFVSNFGMFVGTLGAGPLGERFFHQRYKLLLVVLSSLQVLLLGLFSAAVPTQEDGRDADLRLGPWQLLGVLLVASALNGLTGPLLFELGAEITYPAPESISASAFIFALNAGGMLITAVLGSVGTALQGVGSCLLMAAIVGVGLLLLLPVQEAYHRLAFDTEDELSRSTS